MTRPPENNFDPFGPGGELPDVASFEADLRDYPDIGGQLWTEQLARREWLFEDIYRRLGIVHEAHGTDVGRRTWQAFYSGVQDDQMMRTWVVGRPAAKKVHVITNREDRDTVARRRRLEYQEYVLSTRGPHIASAEASLNGAFDEGWTEANLFHGAFVQRSRDQVHLARGMVNQPPRLDELRGFGKTGLKGWDVQFQIERELLGLGRLLDQCIAAGGYHEPGVVGEGDFR